jgi:hypothetical protein
MRLMMNLRDINAGLPDLIRFSSGADLNTERFMRYVRKTQALSVSVVYKSHLARNARQQRPGAAVHNRLNM